MFLMLAYASCAGTRAHLFNVHRLLFASKRDVVRRLYGARCLYTNLSVSRPAKVLPVECPAADVKQRPSLPADIVHRSAKLQRYCPLSSSIYSCWGQLLVVSVAWLPANLGPHTLPVVPLWLITPRRPSRPRCSHFCHTDRQHGGSCRPRLTCGCGSPRLPAGVANGC